ncbi:hypothetical protein D3C76_345000 [compost metagenome]
MIKINNTTDLPEWFDLEKYKKAENLDAAGWFIQLSLRKELYDLYEMFEKEGQDESSFFIGGEILRGIVRQNLERLRSQPIHTDPINTDSYESLYASCRASGYKEDLSIKPVRELSFQDLTAQRLWDESKGNGKACQQNRWGILTAAELSDCPTEPILVGILGQNQFATLVDMNASDAVLKHAFAAWLKETRKNELGTPPKESSLYKYWAGYGVLPYLDLRIWAMEKRLHIPGRVMSRAICSPNHDCGVENLRKTNARIAISLMRDLSELQALAAVESAT